jgi:hypothetical protein
MGLCTPKSQSVFNIPVFQHLFCVGNGLCLLMLCSVIDHIVFGQNLVNWKWLHVVVGYQHTHVC